MTVAAGAGGLATPHAGLRPSSRPRVAGLYAITPDLADTDRLAALVEAAIAGGARTVQYRNKVADAALRSAQASRIAALCRAGDAQLIVNDHVELAISIDGAGLHVGADDHAGLDALRDLRMRLGTERILGVSCYRDVALARDAVAAGADYVAFGSVFPSTTKPHAPSAALTVFAAARALGVPLVGIGGITLANLPSLVAAGAHAAAVIGTLFASGDPRAVRDSARALADVFAHVLPSASGDTGSIAPNAPTAHPQHFDQDTP